MGKKINNFLSDQVNDNTSININSQSKKIKSLYEMYTDSYMSILAWTSLILSIIIAFLAINVLLRKSRERRRQRMILR